jgi:hypothetical protein
MINIQDRKPLLADGQPSASIEPSPGVERSKSAGSSKLHGCNCIL